MNENELAVMVRAELKKIAGDVNAGLAGAREKQGELQAQVLDLQQRAARRGTGSGDAVGASSEAVQAALTTASGINDLRERRQGARASIDLPAGFFAPRSALLGPAPGQTDRPGTIIGSPMSRTTIRDLLPRQQTDQATISYVQEVMHPSAAAPVAEGELKPESIMEFVLKNSPVVTVAHFTKASNQILDDMSGLEAFIRTKMLHNLAVAEEVQLLSGSGLGNNLAGLIPLATPFVDAVVGSTRIDTLRRAAAQLEVLFFAPSAVVLHPLDWAEIELTKDLQGRFVIAIPRGSNPNQMWSMPVVSSPAIAAGTWVMADFGQVGSIYDRWMARVEIATSGDDFVKNMVTIRCEERLALATHTPSALLKGSFA